MVSVGVQALRESAGIAALLGGFWGDFIYLHTTWCPWLKISGGSWLRCGRQCEEGYGEGSENERPCVWAPQLIVVASGLLCEPPGQRPCLKWLVPYWPRNGLLAAPYLGHESSGPGVELLPVFSGGIKGDVWTERGMGGYMRGLCTQRLAWLASQLPGWNFNCLNGHLHLHVPQVP